MDEETKKLLSELLTILEALQAEAVNTGANPSATNTGANPTTNTGTTPEINPSVSPLATGFAQEKKVAATLTPQIPDTFWKQPIDTRITYWKNPEYREMFIKKWKELYPDQQWSAELGIDWKIYGGYLTKKELNEQKIATSAAITFKDQVSGGITYKGSEFFTWPLTEKKIFWNTNQDMRLNYIKKWKETYPGRRWDDDILGITWNVFGGYLQQ